MYWKQRHTLNFPTQIRFGPGVSDELGAHLKSKDKRKPIIVSDRNLAEMPFVQKIIKRLQSAGLSPSLFVDVDKNPVKSNVVDAKNAYLKTDSDCVVSIGGGASMDVARALCLLVNHPGDLFDYDDAKGASVLITKEIPYFVCLPTTSGTGSEVGRSSVIAEDISKNKRILFSPRLMAPIVFADPELTMDLPGPITAATGIDALTHSTEAFVAKGFNPLCDAIAKESVRLISESLESAYRRKDLTSRSKMMLASLMGATAFQKGLGVVHSCAHPLSASFDTHHGLANALMLPHGIQFNMETSRSHYQSLAREIELKSGEDYHSWVLRLLESLEFPTGLGQLGVRTEDISELAKQALSDPCHQNNPRVCALKDFENLYLQALKGK